MTVPRTEPIKAVRGVRDILPRDRAAWRVVERSASHVARRFGYQEIVTPVIEHAELIERVGEDTDAVAKQLYRFEDRGGRHLALRPEATAGIVRAYFEGGLNQASQPARLYLFGPMFRYDRPGKGRYRQFFQFDIEAIGSSSPAVDVEVIELGAEWLHQAGIGQLRLELTAAGNQSTSTAGLHRPAMPAFQGQCAARHRSSLRRMQRGVDRGPRVARCRTH